MRLQTPSSNEDRDAGQMLLATGVVLLMSLHTFLKHRLRF